MSRRGVAVHVAATATALLAWLALAGCPRIEPVDAHEAPSPSAPPPSIPPAEATAPGADLTFPTERTTGASRSSPSTRSAASTPADPHPRQSEVRSLELDLPPQRIDPRGTGAPPRAADARRTRAVDGVRVRIAAQRLELLSGSDVVRTYPVSTAANGVGSRVGSQRTPLGRHRVHSKYGAGAPLGTIFESRRPTGRIAAIHTAPLDLPEDVITTRILWLEGLEPGSNRGPGVDSHARYIYIHGTNEEGLIGRPASHGCIRMRNADVIELFDLVAAGTPVEIIE